MNRNDIIPANTRVRVLPGFTYCSGQRGSSSDYRELKDAFRSGGIFYSSDTDRAPDSDGDFRVYVRPNREGESGWVHYSFIELAPEGTPEATETVSVQDAFKPGNEIEFSVEGVEFRNALIIKGCKRLNVAGDSAWDHVVKLDREAGTATFKATINPAGNISIPGGGVIDRWEASGHFKDVKITKLGTPPRPDETITFTAEEADILFALIGRTNGTELYQMYQKISSRNRRNWEVTTDGRQVNRVTS